MTTYKNANWTARNYDCTNIVFQTVPDGEAPRRYNGEVAPAGEWVKADSIPAKFSELGGFGGYRFFGFA